MSDMTPLSELIALREYRASCGIRARHIATQFRRLASKLQPLHGSSWETSQAFYQFCQRFYDDLYDQLLNASVIACEEDGGERAALEIALTLHETALLPLIEIARPRQGCLSIHAERREDGHAFCMAHLASARAVLDCIDRARQLGAFAPDNPHWITILSLRKPLLALIVRAENELVKSISAEKHLLRGWHAQFCELAGRVAIEAITYLRRGASAIPLPENTARPIALDQDSRQCYAGMLEKYHRLAKTMNDSFQYLYKVPEQVGKIQAHDSVIREMDCLEEVLNIGLKRLALPDFALNKRELAEMRHALLLYRIKLTAWAAFVRTTGGYIAYDEKNNGPQPERNRKYCREYLRCYRHLLRLSRALYGQRFLIPAKAADAAPLKATFSRLIQEIETQQHLLSLETSQPVFQLDGKEVDAFHAHLCESVTTLMFHIVSQVRFGRSPQSLDVLLGNGGKAANATDRNTKRRDQDQPYGRFTFMVEEILHYVQMQDRERANHRVGELTDSLQQLTKATDPQAGTRTLYNPDCPVATDPTQWTVQDLQNLATGTRYSAECFEYLVAIMQAVQLNDAQSDYSDDAKDAIRALQRFSPAGSSWEEFYGMIAGVYNETKEERAAISWPAEG